MYKNILIPRNIKSRKKKLRQQNIKLLSQEVIEDDLNIDDSFEGIPEELIKVKEVKGYVNLDINKGYIPSWLKNVKIYGGFYCLGNNLTTLDNCPQYIEGSLYCFGNKVKKLQLPEYVKLKGKLYNV